MSAMQQIPAPIEIPDRMPSGVSWELMGRRLALWLWHRGLGLSLRPGENRVPVRPRTPQEEEDRQRRLAAHSAAHSAAHPDGVRRPAVYPMGRSAGEMVLRTERSRRRAEAMKGWR